MSGAAAARGRFITLEGGEGAGKSTQLGRLIERLQAVGIDALATREPGGAPGAEAIRKLLVEGEPGRWDAPGEALLHFAARRDHLLHAVWPALEAGRWVVSDRFADSTMAYQGIAGEVGEGAVRQLYGIAVGHFSPDLTVILDLAAEEGLARAAARPGAETRYERMGIEFHRKLRQAFRNIAAAEPRRCVIIDAARSIDAVSDAVWQAVRGKFTLA